MMSGPSPFHWCTYLHEFGQECGRVGGILRAPDVGLPPWAAALILAGIFLGFTTLFGGSYMLWGRDRL